MIVPSIFFDKQMVVVLHRLYVLMDMTCVYVGDVHLGEYSLLTNIAETDSGLSLKSIKEETGFFDDMSQYVGLLEDQELVARVRSTLDRRGFALKMTPKGRTRLALIDEATAAALIHANKKWSEAEFEYLVTKMHALPYTSETQRRISTIFPGSFLSLVYRYHRLIVRTAAYYGITASQAALLCVSEDRGDVRSSYQATGQLNMPESVIELQVDDLVKKDLIRIEGSFELTEKGAQRVDDFLRKAFTQKSDLFSDYSEDDITLFEELGEYCMYLFT